MFKYFVLHSNVHSVSGTKIFGCFRVAIPIVCVVVEVATSTFSAAITFVAEITTGGH